MSTFHTIPSSSLFLGPAATGRRGFATTFEVNGHQVLIVTPNNATLVALCKEWEIEAPIADIAEPVVVVSRSIVKECTEDDGLDVDDGLDDGL